MNSYLVLLILSVFGTIGIQALSSRFFPPVIPQKPGWNLMSPLGIAMVFTGTLFLSYFVFQWSLGRKPAFLELFLAQMISYGATGFFLWLSVRRAGGWMALGASSVSPKILGVAALSYLCFLPPYFFSIRLGQDLLQFFDKEFPAQKVLMELLNVPQPGFSFLLLGIVLAGPFFEELFFRAFLLPPMQQRFGDKAGLIFTSILFASLHEPVAYVSTFALGLFCGYLYRRSGKIWVPFAVHALHNGLMVSIWIAVPHLRETMGQK